MSKSRILAMCASVPVMSRPAVLLQQPISTPSKQFLPPATVMDLFLCVGYPSFKIEFIG